VKKEQLFELREQLFIIITYTYLLQTSGMPKY